MADLFDLSLRAYSRLENEGAIPTEENLRKIAARLHVSEIDLFRPEKEEDSELKHILEVLSAAHKSELGPVISAIKAVEKAILERTGGRKAR